MLLHITPRLICSHWGPGGRSLIDVAIPEMGVVLQAGREVMAKTPFPNKRHLVVSAKARKAQMGILLDVGDPPPAFTVVTRWNVEGEAVLTHEVVLQIADRRHEVIAACASDWAMWGSDEWRWESVKLPWMTVNHTMGLDAYMDERTGGRESSVRPFDDTVEDGLIVRRRETMPVPTIERDRYEWLVMNSMHARSMPALPIEPIRVRQ